MIRRTNRQQSRVGCRVASLALAAALVSFAGVAQALTLDFTGESGENLLGLGTGVLGHSIDISVGPLVQASGDSPFGPLEDCGNFPSGGVNFLNSEVEPWLDAG